MAEREFLIELPDGLRLSSKRWYERFVIELLDNPGKWTRLDGPGDDTTYSSDRAGSLCSTIKRRDLVAFAHAPAGEFEAERVLIEDDADGGSWHVYVRFTFAEPEPEPEPEPAPGGERGDDG